MIKNVAFVFFTICLLLGIKTYTEAVEQYDVNDPHVVINQIYGAGDGGYVSHSFIELYNPTSDNVNLSGWSLQYRSSKTDEECSGLWQKYALSDNTVIPSHSSLLVRCDRDSSGKANNEYRLDLSDESSYDLSWEQRINTKGCAVVLRSSNDLINEDEEVFDNDNNMPVIDGYVDLLAVSGNDFPSKPKQAIGWYEGRVEAQQSKKKGIRRIDFRDTDNNAEDSEPIDYSSAVIDEIRPRSLRDGAWPKEIPVNRSISFNRLSGFYDDEFTLTMETDSRGKIYYTLDGSEPVPGNSTTYEYSGGILIKDVTENENYYSMNQNISLGYTYTDKSGYELPKYKIDKCTALRAKAYYSDGSSSPIYTKSYFVGMNGRESISNVNVVSITAEPDDLFGYEKGIYVLGKTYDDNKSDNSSDWVGVNGNFRKKGDDWERKAQIDFFNDSHELLLSQEGGIRIHGGWPRGFAFKSLNLYARNEYGGVKKFNYDFFNTGYLAKKLTLCSGSNDKISKSADYLINLACIKNKYYSVAHRIPYALFLNGEYWGIYFLTEKYDDKYIEKTYGVDADNVVMVKNGSIEEGSDKDIELWYDMRSFIINHNMNVEENYKKACELLDIDSFVYYYSTEIFVQNRDWPMKNYALWRARETGKGQYEDGCWRWMLFDVNHERILNDDNYDNIKWTVDKDPIFKSLMHNKLFRHKFANALSKVGKEYFDKDKMQGLIDQYEADYLTALEASYDRYFGKEKDSKIHDELNRRKQFFNNRYDKIMGYMNYYLENPDALLKKYAVSFESNGGSSVAKIYTDGGLITNAPQNPSREGYEFEGWYKDSGCKTRWDFSRDTVNSNLILYAGWKQIPDNTLKEPEEDPKSPVDVPEIPNEETRVPLLKNSTYASSADNFAPVLKASNIKNLALDFTNVDQSSIDGNSLSTTVIQGSVLKTVDEVASVVSTEKKLKVKLNKKTGIATVIANKSGSVRFNMKSGKTYTISFIVEKPKAVKKAKKMKVEPGKTVSLSAQDLFGTSIDAGSMKILSHKIKNNSEIKENKLFIKPECKDRIRAEYSYLNKKYRITINVK